ncbi:MAG: hypothetical protein KJ579_01855 [Verrucomicrobia bacterium]|nr:hypothetical protein [Verrucomicrobiota bacterium]
MKTNLWWVAVLLCGALLPAGAKDTKKGPGDAVAPPPDKAAPPADPAAPVPPGSYQGPAYAEMDQDKDNTLTWSEFLVAQAVAMGKTADQAKALPAKDQTRVRKMFKEADKDRSDNLTSQEWDAYCAARIAAKVRIQQKVKSAAEEEAEDDARMKKYAR